MKRHLNRISVAPAQQEGPIDVGPLTVWLGTIIAWFKFKPF